MNLFELAPQLREAVDALYESEDAESYEAVAALLAQLEGTAEQKVEWIVKLIREDEALGEAAEAEAKRITTYARARNNAAKNKRKYLAQFMFGGKVDKVTTPIGSVRLNMPKASVEVDTSFVHQWPKEVYDRVVTERIEVNRTKLKADFSDTMLELPGVTEKLGEPSVTIR